MKSLIIGMGFGNLYKDELTKLGYEITTLDADVSKGADFSSIDDIVKNTSKTKTVYDTVNICTPNFTHEPIARQIAPFAKIVFVEKPGVKNAERWGKLVSDFPNTKFMMVKNNQYRKNLSILKSLSHHSTVININWINKDRVPNPGTWFTDKSKAFGGVSRDLMPHLLSLFIALEPNYALREGETFISRQCWKLSDLTKTDYGTVNPNGKYDVDDMCKFSFSYNEKVWNLTATWRSLDKDKRNIEFETSTIDLGLCPNDAYSLMIQTAVANLNNNAFWDDQLKQDLWIHERIEKI